MGQFTKNMRRIGIDAAGYGLVALGIALGWLPGPGGIPLVLIGLALLSVHNKWAYTLRAAMIKHSGRFIEIIFPPRPTIQRLYDVLTVLLFVTAILLSWRRSAIWQVSLAFFLFFLALLIATYNRDRFGFRRRKNSKIQK